MSEERAQLLALAEKIINKSLRQGPDGWVELAEKPEDGEQNYLGGEAIKHAGDGVVE